ncbi:hypothetical protein OS738_004745 [Salmonella enterica]|nr:hypothetical protein [Salmonella enterica]
MKAKIVANLFYIATVASLAYGFAYNNNSVAGLGVAVAWVVIALIAFLTLSAVLVAAAGNDEQKAKAKEALSDENKGSKLRAILKPSLLFILLGLSGFWVTAVTYGLASLAFNGITSAAKN